MSQDSTLNPGTGGDVTRMVQRGGTGPKTQVIAIDLGGAYTNAENLATGGQQTGANSVPVVIASDQSVLPVAQKNINLSGTLTTSPTDIVTFTVPDGMTGLTLDTSTGWVGALSVYVQTNGTTYNQVTDPIAGNVSLIVGTPLSFNVSGVQTVKVQGVFSSGPITVFAHFTQGVNAALQRVYIANTGSINVAGTVAAGIVGNDSYGTISAVNANQTSGSPTTNSTVVVSNLQNAGMVSIEVPSAFVGTMVVQYSNGNSTWVAATASTIVNCATNAVTASITAAGFYKVPSNGAVLVRVSCTAYTSGTPFVYLHPVSGGDLKTLDSSSATIGTVGLVAGSALVGGVNISQVAGTTAVTGGLSGILAVGGPAATGASNLGNPVRIGGRVISGSSSLTSGNISDVLITTGGQTITKEFGTAETDWQYAAASGGITNTTAVAIKAAGGAGVRNYLTAISIVNASATVATEVVVLDGATVIGRFYIGANILLNSALNMVLPTPLRGTAATAMNAQCITTGAQVYINAQGYTSV